MAGRDPLQQGDDPLMRSTTDGLIHTPPPAVGVPGTQVPAGRRISFTAWGLAGVAGVAIWALIFKFA